MINYLYGILLIAALVLICFAMVHYNKTAKLLADGIKTKGKVIELIEVNDGDGYTYKPVFEYYDRDNIRREYRPNFSSSPSPYEVNDIVEVVYNPKALFEHQIVSYWGLYRMVIILLSIASPLLVISCGFFIYNYK